MGTLLKNFSTIAELYLILGKEYAKKGEKPLLKYRKDGNWVEVSYEQFGEEVENFALGLHKLGVKAGDKVAIISENRPEWVYSDMAIVGLGAVDVPIYPSLTADTIEFILDNSESVGAIVSNKYQLNKLLKIQKKLNHLKFIIVFNQKDCPENEENIFTFAYVQEIGKKAKAELGDFFIESCKKVKETDLLTIIYTSGTTGEPKGVMLTHKNVVSNVKAAVESLPVDKNDVFLSFLPLCHIFERTTGYYTAYACGCLVAYSESIDTVAQNLLEIKPTIVTTVPRLFERIYGKIKKNVENQPEFKQKLFNWAVQTGHEYRKALKNNSLNVALIAKYKLADKLVLKKIRDKTGGRIKYFVSGGAALAPELGEFFEALGIIILEGYGLTETSPVISCNRYDNYKFGTVGKIFSGVEVKIASDGEILVKGPNVMQGYYKNKKETEAAFSDGWFHTGDIGVFDAEGFLIIRDRKKHLFKTSGGKYIAPTPIENLFLQSKYIDQFVLIGDRRMFLTALIVPDFEAIKEYADSNNISYEKVEDLVQKKEIYDLIEKDLAVLQKNLASFERIRKFTLLEQPFSLERGEITPTMKIRRKVIEERYRDLIENMYKEFEK